MPNVIADCLGPDKTSYQVFEEVYTAANPGSDSKPEVLILRDGFTQFQAKFKEDADLVEKWDKEVWNEEYS